MESRASQLRDVGGRDLKTVEKAAASGTSCFEATRLPIGSQSADYNRVKCFAMLTDVADEGGPLGLGPLLLQQKQRLN